ncbi:MAG: hypothetical protein ABW146_08465 [Candidatus Sedimenticola sp. 6PFRAG7]
MQKSHLSPDLLPPAAADIAEAIGLDGLLRLVDARPGVHLRVPSRIKPDHYLAGVLTRRQYEVLVKTYRNEEIYIPRLHAARLQLLRAEARALASQGKTRTQIALHQGVCERTVYNRLTGDDDKAQMGLFEEERTGE